MQPSCSAFHAHTMVQIRGYFLNHFCSCYSVSGTQARYAVSWLPQIIQSSPQPDYRVVGSSDGTGSRDISLVLKVHDVFKYGQYFYSKGTLRVSRVSAESNDARLHHKNSLQHYLRQMNCKAPSYVISQGECQMAFQHWVAFVRGHDRIDTSDVSAKEHLRCPLLWCRESFDDLASTLQHVSKCPWLSNAWYWCPFCCHPESFMGSEEPYVNPRRNNIQRKDSKMRRAVTYFKNLGLKSCSRQRTSRSSAADPTEPFDTWYNTLRAAQQEAEMEDTSHKHSGPAELANSSSNFQVPQSYIEKRAGSVYEMEDASTDISHTPSCPSWYTQQRNPVSQLCELDIEAFITEPRPRAELASPENPFTAIGAQFEGKLRDAEPTEEILVSPALTV